MKLIALSLEFTNLSLLIGVLAAAIPVLLHLLAKVRAPQVFFPTLRFLRMSMDKTARRRRVQHWLLMLLRMLALAVLAIAVAQPLVRAVSDTLGSDRDTAVVIVLDNSLSMQTRADGATRFTAAKAAATQFLNDRNFQRAALIVTNGEPARTLPAELSDRFEVLKQVEAVAPGVGQANLVAAIGHAQQLLAAAGQPNKEIYLFSDMQGVSLRGLDALNRGQGEGDPPSLLVISPTAAEQGPADAPVARDAGPINLAVTEVVIDQPNLMARQPVYIDATIRNFSRSPQKVLLRLSQDGVEQSELSDEVVQLSASDKPGAVQHVLLKTAWAEPGARGGSLRVDRLNESGQPDEDDLPEDNVRHFAVRLSDSVNVLLVKQRHELDPSADAGRLLRRIMSTQVPGGPPAPFRLTEITAGEFDPGLLRTMQVAITSDLPDFSPEQAQALTEFARRGGTWMIWLGPSVDLNRYNQVLGVPSDEQPAVLGGKLLRFEGNAAAAMETLGEPVFVQWVDESHPMFAKLMPDMSAYRHLMVFRYAVLKANPRQFTRVVARLISGDPLVVETPVGLGRVQVITTGSTPQWSNWLARGYAYAIYQMLLSAATRPRHDAALQFRENEQAALPLPATLSAELAEVAVTAPDQQTRRVKVDRPAQAQAASPPLFRYDGTSQLGEYRWELVESADTVGSAGSLGRGLFVVNAPADESDLTPMAADQLRAALPGRTVLVAGSAAALREQIEQLRQGWPIWPYLLAAVLVLLAIEVKLANRSRPTSESGLRPAFTGESTADGSAPAA